MKVTIEEINGKNCTIIRKPFDADWVKEQLSMGIPVIAGDSITNKRNILIRFVRHNREGCYKYRNNEWFECCLDRSIPEVELTSIITILPALPKHPKPEDAPLLYAYMAQGLFLWTANSDVIDRFYTGEILVEITHCTHNDERVEIAIEETP